MCLCACVSKKDVALTDQKATLSTNDIVINKLTQILSYLRAGTRTKKKKKVNIYCVIPFRILQSELFSSKLPGPYRVKTNMYVYHYCVSVSGMDPDSVDPDPGGQK